MAQTQTAHISLSGGLNMVTPPMTTPAGYLLDVLNFMPALDSGYTRIPGYCRYDGQEEPWRRSAVGIYISELDGFSIQDTITGDDGSSGKLVYINDDERALILCDVSGSFANTSTISNGSNSVEVVSVTTPYGSSLDQEKAAIESWYRSKTMQPPGTGRIAGLFYGLHELFVFREDVGKVRVFKASRDSWQEIDFHHILEYQDAGVNQPQEGSVLKTDTDARCTVIKHQRQTGSSDDNSVSGYCLIEDIEGELTEGDELILGEYAAGTLDGTDYQLLILQGSPELIVYPDPGDTITSSADEPATALVAEPIASEITGSDTVRLSLLVKEVSGSFTKADIITHTPQGTDTPITIGTITESPESVNRLIADNPDQLPNTNDRLVFPEATANLKQRLTIDRESGDKSSEQHHYLRLINITGTINNNDSVQVTIMAGAVRKAPWLYQLALDGRFEFIEHNFYGSQSNRRIYGCNGVNEAFEFDGQYMMPILMGDEDNHPNAIVAHKQHLFLGLNSGLLRHSVVGEPLNFNGQLGAFELAIGEHITALHSTSGGVLLIACRNQMHILYGNTIADWQKQMLSNDSGALPNTVISLGNTLALDDIGVVQIDRVEAFGDFEYATISRLIQPLLNDLRVRVTGCSVIRDYNQVRYYFDNGTALAIKINPGGLPDITRLEYITEPVCVCYGENRLGEPVVFFGGRDGWIYRDNVGTNFDGEPINAFFQTSYAHLGSPALRKSYKRIELDFSGEYGTTVYLSAEIDYSEEHVPTIRAETIDITGGGGYWDMSNWNEFYWSSNTVNSGGLPVTGTGRNISMLVTGEHTWQSPYTIYGFYVHYIPRRLHRG